MGATEADMDEIKHMMSIGMRRVIIMQVHRSLGRPA
jgi:hypothetical protein